MTPATAGSHRAEMRSLPPILTVDGNDYLLMVAQLAGIAARELRPPLIDLPGQRSAIVISVMPTPHRRCPAADSSDREQRFHAMVNGAWVSQLVHAFLLDPFTIGQRDGAFSH